MHASTDYKLQITFLIHHSLICLYVSIQTYDTDEVILIVIEQKILAADVPIAAVAALTAKCKDVFAGQATHSLVFQKKIR